MIVVRMPTKLPTTPAATGSATRSARTVISTSAAATTISTTRSPTRNQPERAPAARVLDDDGLEAGLQANDRRLEPVEEEQHEQRESARAGQDLAEPQSGEAHACCRVRSAIVAA